MSGVQLARPAGIMRNPGLQGGQARPRDSGTTVHFEPSLSDVPEEPPSVGPPSVEPPSVEPPPVEPPSLRAASPPVSRSGSSASDSSASASAVPALSRRAPPVALPERPITPEFEHERPIREPPPPPPAMTEDQLFTHLQTTGSPLARMWGLL